jgi:acetyl-CoA C-acetyltransferase
MKTAYIVDILRTPIGRYGGALASVRPDDLAATVIRELIRRNPTLDLNLIEDVIFGAANQSGEDNRNVARMALLLAGLPTSIAGVTVNRLCASGLQAIMNAAYGIMTDNGEVYIAGGVESMSRAPYVVAKSYEAFSRNVNMVDTTLGWRFTNPALATLHYPFSMGETAENIAEKWKIKRKDQDRFGWNSQEKYFKAEANGLFAHERMAVAVARGKETIIVDRDEYPRETSLEKLAALKPAFRESGTVTAGNSSGINDGAAASLVVSEKALKTFGLRPLARIVSMAVAGVDPALMGIGPVPATQKALQRAGLKITDLGRVELNEAFASQSLACIQELGLNPEIVNVNGGAISLGHPLGCSGVRISATLLHEMSRQSVKYGLATMCIGVGQGAAIVYENMRN